MRGKPSFTASMKKVGSLGSIVNVKWYYLVEASRKSLQVACQEKTFQSLGWSASPKVERPFMKPLLCSCVFYEDEVMWWLSLSQASPPWQLAAGPEESWTEKTKDKQVCLSEKKPAEGVTDSKTKFKWWFKNCFVVQLPLEIVGSSCLSKALFPHLQNGKNSGTIF